MHYSGGRAFVFYLFGGVEKGELDLQGLFSKGTNSIHEGPILRT